jgi:hypothetical protein
MPRYFFDTLDGDQFISDDIGVELPSSWQHPAHLDEAESRGMGLRTGSPRGRTGFRLRDDGARQAAKAEAK